MTQYLLEEAISDPMDYDRPYRINFQTKDEALFIRVRDMIRVITHDYEHEKILEEEYAKAQSE